MSNKTVIDAAFNKHLKKAENALFKAGIIMSDTSKEILQINKKYVTREVYKGIYQNLTIQPGKMILTFGNNARSKSGFPYAASVETGRKAGIPPPSQSIKEWLIERARVHGDITLSYFKTARPGGMGPFKESAYKKNMFFVEESATTIYKNLGKHLKTSKSANDLNKKYDSLAFCIARKIGRTGTKPFPFMTPGYNAGLKKFLELINA